jgi:hypothetical protein
VVALVLAAAAFIPPIARITWTYLGLALAAAEFSLGTNGFLFPLLQDALGVSTSLRSPARFAVLVLLSVAVLAAIGAARVFERSRRLAPLVGIALTVLCVAEYWSAPLPTRPFDPRPSEAHLWLAQHPAGTVVLELPAPTGATLWLRESVYQVRSINHWQPLVNGYSAFAPENYVRLINELPRFPERHVIEMLREIGVKFILLNREFYAAEDFDRVMQAATATTRLRPPRTFGEGLKQVVVFELTPSD